MLLSNVSPGEVLGGLALAALVVKEAFAFARTKMNSSDKLVNGRSGDKPIAFWEKAILDANIAGNNATVVPILSEIAKTNTQIATLLDVLVNRQRGV